MPASRSLAFRAKKMLNDLLRRVTGYQFVKAQKLEALESAAGKGTKAKPSAGRR